MYEFKTIKENVSAQIIEKKSKFIANIVYVENSKEAEDYIKQIKKKYYDAKHNCFAYIIMGENGEYIKKCSDDGEPTGTAGIPILETIEKQNLCNILVVVTRYFGGILLGTGGLFRAYLGATLEALNNAEFINKVQGYEAKIVTEYGNLEQLKYNLEKEKIKIININYSENVELIVQISEEQKNKNLEKFTENVKKIEIITKKYIDI